MTEKMKAFLEEAEKDEAFAEKVNGADSPETVIALAKEKGFELTEEDLLLEAADGELADEELDDVAGGSLISPVGAWSGLTALLLRRFGGRRTLLNQGTSPIAQTMEFRGGAPVAQTMEFRGGAPLAQTMQQHVDVDTKFYNI